MDVVTSWKERPTGLKEKQRKKRVKMRGVQNWVKARIQQNVGGSGKKAGRLFGKRKWGGGKHNERL